MRTKNLLNGSTNHIPWQSREQQVLGSYLLQATGQKTTGQLMASETASMIQQWCSTGDPCLACSAVGEQHWDHGECLQPTSLLVQCIGKLFIPLSIAVFTGGVISIKRCWCQHTPREAASEGYGEQAEATANHVAQLYTYLEFWCFVPFFALLLAPASQSWMERLTSAASVTAIPAKLLLNPAHLPMPTAQPSAF